MPGWPKEACSFWREHVLELLRAHVELLRDRVEVRALLGRDDAVRERRLDEKRERRLLRFFRQRSDRLRRFGAIDNGKNRVSIGIRYVERHEQPIEKRFFRGPKIVVRDHQTSNQPTQLGSQFFVHVVLLTLPVRSLTAAGPLRRNIGDEAPALMTCTPWVLCRATCDVDAHLA